MNLSDVQRKVTIIPAKPQLQQQIAMRKKNVAAYCRVSTEEEEQQSSYEAQCSYYTDLIMKNPEWNMAGIFADAPVIIGLKQNPTQMGAALVLFSLFTGIFENFR